MTKIPVSRQLISNIANALGKVNYENMGQFSCSEFLYALDNINQILEDNPLPEKWAVVRIDDIVIKGNGTPQVSTEIMGKFNSQKEAEEWVMKAKFHRFHPHSNYYNVKVEE